MTRSGDGAEPTVVEFTDYVEDITKQFARAAQDMALPTLADALSAASAIASLERVRLLEKRRPDD